MVTVAEAYAACERLARDHYENFPVASLLLPSDMRPHIAAIYAFARTADDFADEGDRQPDERLRLLDDWLAQLHDSVGIRDSGFGIRGGVSGGLGAAADMPGFQRSAQPNLLPGVPAVPHANPEFRNSAHAIPAPSVSAVQHPNPESRVPNPVFVALAETIRVHSLPLALFEDLISAFKQDVTVKRYETWDDVLDYCRRSANPVGRLVLRVAGAASDEADRASDAVCTALQLANFWQDFERDWLNGRLYVPRADRERFGAREEDLAARALTPAWRLVMGEMASRTEALFDRGRPVCDMVPGRLKWELRFTWLGGRRILSRLGRAGFDVFGARPALGLADAPALLWQALVWR